MVEVLLEAGGQEVAVADNALAAQDVPIPECQSCQNISKDNESASPIQEFYNGQSIFITGGTGFMGKLLVDKLLRCCPGIAFIYLLVRPKKGKDVHQRTEELFDDPVFSRLKQVHPKFRHQIVAISGDCSLPNLGISPAEKAILIRDISIVFHVAATVRFDEKLKLAVSINVQSPRDMIDLCKEFPKLKAFIHVSTAYANCIHNEIDEKFYDTPIEGNKLISLMECIDEKLVDDITPQLLGKWPNTYTYTKAIAESVIRKEGQDLPMGIFRPAIVISTYKEPLRGWIDNMYGPTGVAAGAGTGLLRTMHCDGDMLANVVPGDMTINALIASAWDVADIKKNNKNSNEIPIYNYVCKDNPITWDELKIMSAKYGLDLPTSRAVWYYSFRNTKSRVLHLFYVYLLHLLPALLVDTFSLAIGKPPRMLKIYKKIHRFMDVLNYFTSKEWKFTNNNVHALISKLSVKDRKLFYLDMRDVSWDEFFQNYMRGLRIYLIKDPIETLPQARIRWQRMYWLHQSLKILLAYCFLRLAWLILFELYKVIV